MTAAEMNAKRAEWKAQKAAEREARLAAQQAEGEAGLAAERRRAAARRPALDDMPPIPDTSDHPDVIEARSRENDLRARQAALAAERDEIARGLGADADKPEKELRRDATFAGGDVRPKLDAIARLAEVKKDIEAVGGALVPAAEATKAARGRARRDAVPDVAAASSN